MGKQKLPAHLEAKRDYVTCTDKLNQNVSGEREGCAALWSAPVGAVAALVCSPA
jgi:hypothetical protein